VERERRILLVDDDPGHLTTLAEALVRAGYRVRGARSGSEALAKLATRPIDLVITDYQMSPINGLELIREIRRHIPHLPVLIMTGDPSPDLEELSKAAGAVAFIRKPFQLETLLRLIAELLQD
jgi:two-component system response regulator FlrC